MDKGIESLLWFLEATLIMSKYGRRVAPNALITNLTQTSLICLDSVFDNSSLFRWLNEDGTGQVYEAS